MRALIGAILFAGFTAQQAEEMPVPKTAPKLDGTVEEAARSYLTFLHEKRGIELADRMGLIEQDLADAEGEADRYEDPEQYRKELRRQKEWLASMRANRKALETIEFADEKVEEDGGRTKYTVTLRGRRLVPDGDEKWKLEDSTEKRKLTFCRIEGQWKLVEGND